MTRYFLAILIIGLVSTYDTVLTHITADQLLVECVPGTTENGYYSYEQNPICEWMIEHRGIGGLIEYKSVGVIIATMILFALSYTRYRRLIWLALAAQLTLFCFLNFSVVPAPPNLTHSHSQTAQDTYVVPKMVMDFYRDRRAAK
jgi:hypothetical protein